MRFLRFGERHRSARRTASGGGWRSALGHAFRAVRHPTWRGVASVVGALLVGGFLLGGLPRVDIETSVASFLPPDDPAVRQYESVSKSFGGDPIVVLAESDQPRKLLDQGHIATQLKLEGQLARLPNVAATYGPATTLNQIAGRAQDVLAELSGMRDAIGQYAGERAAARFDARYGSLIVQGLPAGLPTLHNPSFINTVAYAPDGGVQPQWRFVVPSEHAIAVLVRPREGMDQSSVDRLVDDVRRTVAATNLDADRVTVSGVPVVASALAEQARSEIPLLGGIAIAAITACFVLIPWTVRRRVRLVPVASTILAVGLTVATFGWLDRPLSLGVVAFLPVLLGIGSYYPTYFLQSTRRRVVLAVAAATTGAFAALLLSPLRFVRDLGLALAIGVFIAAAAGLVIARWVPREWVAPRATDPASGGVSRSRSPTRSPWSRVTVAAVAIAVAATGWGALPQLPLKSDFDSFAAGLDAVDDARHVESVMGSSGEMAVVLRGHDVLAPPAIAWARQAHETVVRRHGDQMRPVISPPVLLPFLGPSPSAEQINAAVRLMPPYLTGAVFGEGGRTALLSYGVRMEDLSELRSLRDDLVQALPKPPVGHQVELTGLSMVAVRANELASTERLATNLAGILAAGGVLMLGLRRRADAFRAIGAAALATGTGLFVLWTAGIPLTPITAALGSLTAAVGCEFTVLLAESARRGNRFLRRSVFLATATSAVGYATLAASQLHAVREFGVQLAGSVLLALGGAVVVIWLSGPGGVVRRGVGEDDQRPEPATLEVT